MRQIILALAFVFTIYHSNAQSFETVQDRTGKMMLKGFVTDSILKSDTVNYGWYGPMAKVYKPKDEIVKQFSASKDSVSFLVFFGTWCADSHYVIPRFFNIKEAAGIDNSHITLFALDRTKKDPAHFASALGIAHVPTIIVYKNGKELGRVVEYGATGRFDEELATILHAN